MKKLIKIGILGLVAVVLAIGLWFACQRPAYVKEAIDILFTNELTEEEIKEQNDLP